MFQAKRIKNIAILTWFISLRLFRLIHAKVKSGSIILANVFIANLNGMNLHLNKIHPNDFKFQIQQFAVKIFQFQHDYAVCTSIGLFITYGKKWRKLSQHKKKVNVFMYVVLMTNCRHQTEIVLMGKNYRNKLHFEVDILCVYFYVLNLMGKVFNLFHER